MRCEEALGPSRDGALDAGVVYDGAEATVDVVLAPLVLEIDGVCSEEALRVVVLRDKLS